jgi:hypothetical protein
MSTNLKQYTDLRTLLDSLEVGALRFYLSGKGMSPRQKYKYLKEKLMPIIDDVWHQPVGTNHPVPLNHLSEVECPPGYYACDGVCVPYNCPDVISATISARKKPKATKRKS